MTDNEDLLVARSLLAASLPCFRIIPRGSWLRRWRNRKVARDAAAILNYVVAKMTAEASSSR